MKRARQPLLPGFDGLGIKEFGGSLLRGNPREARPVSTKRALHVVMRSSLARRERSLLNPVRARRIKHLVYAMGERHGVRIYRFANSGNHLHLLVLPRSRKAFHAYIRAISGLIARITLGAERGRARGERFWDARPFTRIVEWGREFSAVCAYVLQNTLEAVGFIPFQPRKGRRKKGRYARAPAPAAP